MTADDQKIDENLFAQAVQLAATQMRPTDRDLPEVDFWKEVSNQVDRAYRGLQVARQELGDALIDHPDVPFGVLLNTPS